MVSPSNFFLKKSVISPEMGPITITMIERKPKIRVKCPTTISSERSFLKKIAMYWADAVQAIALGYWTVIRCF